MRSAHDSYTKIKEKERKMKKKKDDEKRPKGTKKGEGEEEIIILHRPKGVKKTICRGGRKKRETSPEEGTNDDFFLL